MQTKNNQQHDFAIISAYRKMFVDATSMTFDDRPQELKDFDIKRGVFEPHLKTPYRYTDEDNERRNRDLQASLLCHHYGIAYLHQWNVVSIEEFSFCCGSDDFLVVNVNEDPQFHDTIFALSEYYNRDHFMYGDVTKRVLNLVHTNGVLYNTEDECSKLSDGDDETIEGSVLEDFDELTIKKMMEADSIIWKNIKELKNAGR